MDRSAYEALLEPNASLEEVYNAFSGFHPHRDEYYWTCLPRLERGIIFIEGQIFCREEQIGRFIRELHSVEGRRHAYHVIIEIDDEHHDNRLALYHYKKALAFYDKHRYRAIHMEAANDGWIWPQFGFDIRRIEDKSRLRELLHECGVRGMPENPAELYAPKVSGLDIGGRLVGQEALAQLVYEKDGILMDLILDDNDQRGLLVASGILGLEQANERRFQA